VRSPLDPDATPAAQAVWLQPAELSEWDEFVESSPLGLPYHASAWKDTLERAFPHISGKVLALREPGGQRILAGVPVYSVRSWLLGNRLVSVPFASVFDPIVSGPEPLAHLLPQIASLQRGTRARHWEVRALKARTALQVQHLTPDQEFWHHCLDLQPDPRSIFGGFHQTAVRQTIRKAERLGIKARPGSGPEFTLAFYAILTQTRKRLGLPALPFGFFESVLRCFGPRSARIHLAYLGSEPIASLLLLQNKRICIAEYAGDTATHRRTGANQLLYWEAIKQARADGCRLFSFGRTSLGNSSLRNYKLRWNTFEEKVASFHSPQDRQAGTSLGRLTFLKRVAQAVIHRLPDRLHRSTTPLVYRHWG
jgi:hypothetical protein